MKCVMCAILYLVVVTICCAGNAPNAASLLSSRSMAASNQENMCVDEVCSTNFSQADFNSSDSLREKVFSEWQSARAPADADLTQAEYSAKLPNVTNTDSSNDSIEASGTHGSNDEHDVAAVEDTAIDENLKALVALGWPSEDASTALKTSHNDITLAAEWLEAQEQQREEMQLKVKELVMKGNWEEHAAYSALQHSQGSVTAAEELLQREENTTVTNFNTAVKDMVSI